MKPSEQAKAAGLKDLNEVSRLTEVKVGTLINWHKNKPRLFKVVLKGCMVMKVMQGDKPMLIKTNGEII